MPKRRPTILGVIASLLITAVIVMPIAFLSTPALIRWKMTRGLTHADETQRQRSLNYVARRASGDAKVLDAAIKAMSVPDDQNFQQIFHAIDMAGLWHRQYIPDEPWLRWLNILGSHSDPENRIMAIRQTVEMRDLAADPRLLKLLDQWMLEDNDLVRYNTLIALADLSAHAPQPRHVQERLTAMTGDRLPAIAAEAWLFLGLLNPISGTQANWKEVPPEVAAAMLWSATTTNPTHPRPAVEALTDPAQPAGLRAAAAYALAASTSEQAADALQKAIDPSVILLPASTTGPQADQAWIAWRAILSTKQAAALPPAAEALTVTPEPDQPLLWATLHQQARLNGLTNALLARLTPDRLIAHPVASLAILEGLAPGSADLPECPANAPPYIRLAWTRATKTPQVAAIRELFAHDSAPMRDLACIIAWQRFDEATNTQLIISLLRDYNDNAKCSGAILAGLTGISPLVTIRGHWVDLLPEKMDDEDIWTVKQMHRIGLWMLDKQPEMDQEFAGLLSRPDMPSSTLLLALLKKYPQQAMNELFSPMTDPPRFRPQTLNARQPAPEPVTLHDLLVRYRWVHVLQALQPEGTPDFWLWADPDLQTFQLQVIRNHWLISRKTSAWAVSLSDSLSTAESQKARP